MAEFKKLDDLPKGRPNTYDEVMKAMSELHKLVMKQAAAYGGKNSKYLPAHVVETSLLKSFSNPIELSEDKDAVGELLGTVHDLAEKLSKHLDDKGDEEGLKMLGKIFQLLGAAIGASKEK